MCDDVTEELLQASNRQIDRLEAIMEAERERLRAIRDELVAAATEAVSALYGARECLGSIANIQHAIDLSEAAIAKAKPCAPET